MIIAAILLAKWLLTRMESLFVGAIQGLAKTLHSANTSADIGLDTSSSPACALQLPLWRSLLGWHIGNLRLIASALYGLSRQLVRTSLARCNGNLVRLRSGHPWLELYCIKTLSYQPPLRSLSKVFCSAERSAGESRRRAVPEWPALADYGRSCAGQRQPGWELDQHWTHITELVGT